MGVAPLATDAVYHRQDAPFLTFPPAGGKGHGRFGKGVPSTTPRPRHPGPAVPVIPAFAGNHAAPTAIPLPGPVGNQPNPKNHPNQTNHSSRPSRHPGYVGMGVSSLRSHSWAGGNLLSLRAGVAWIPAFAGKTAGMGADTRSGEKPEGPGLHACRCRSGSLRLRDVGQSGEKNKENLCVLCALCALCGKKTLW